MSDQRAVLGHCGACRSPILSGIIHECAGVRAFRLAQAAGPRTLARFAALFGSGTSPEVAAEMAREFGDADE